MKTRVGQVMTKPAITVHEKASFKEIVELLEERRISAVPVVDAEGRVVGVVSEADLLLKEEMAEEPEPRLLLSRSRRTDRAKAAGRTARELMSSPALTASPALSLGQAARIMHSRGVKRLPVVDEDNRPLGLVSRADLLRVYTRDDAEIQREVVDELIVKTLWLDPKPIEVTVREGVVRLAGEVDRKSDVVILSRLAAAADGVVGVEASGLRYRYDDSAAVELPRDPGARSTPPLLRQRS